MFQILAYSDSDLPVILNLLDCGITMPAGYAAPTPTLELDTNHTHSLLTAVTGMGILVLIVDCCEQFGTSLTIPYNSDLELCYLVVVFLVQVHILHRTPTSDALISLLLQLSVILGCGLSIVLTVACFLTLSYGFSVASAAMRDKIRVDGILLVMLLAAPYFLFAWFFH